MNRMKTMKYLVPALMLFAGVACTKEIAAPEQDNVQEEATEQLELSASLSDVRTSLSGVKTLWSPGDEIAVRKIWQEDGSTSRTSRWYKFTAKGLTAASASAKFAGSIATRDVDVYTLEAVYPYESALASEAGTINLTIPSEQKAKAGSFGEKAAVAVGKSVDDNVNVNALTFSNVGSAMKFKLVHDASSVVISSTSPDAPVAGKFSYSGGKLTKLSDAVSSVTVSGEMKAGETYYAIVAPGTYKISAEISGEKVKESSAEIKFEANMINNLGIIADVNQIPNCYIVKPGESVDIPVYKAFAMWEKAKWTNDASRPSIQIPKDVRAYEVWEDASGLLTNIENGQFPISTETKLQERFFTVTAAADKHGNAAVAIRFNNDIRWTVHIWVTDYAGSSYQASNGLEFMDRNLGATSKDVKDPNSFGCYYQACRPTPFPGPADAKGSKIKSLYINGIETENVITYPHISNPSFAEDVNCRWAFKYPTDFLFHDDSDTREDAFSWLASASKISKTDYAVNFWPSKTNRKKTAYDPCPAGWMLPVYDESGNSPYSFWASASDDVLKTYPAAGRLKFDLTYDVVGSTAVLWCGDPTGLKTCSAYINFKTDNTIERNAEGNHSRANALPVRCVKIK